MSGNRAANQILAIIVIGLVAVFILRFVACGANVASVAMMDDDERAARSGYTVEQVEREDVYEEMPDVGSQRVPGAYYPDQQAADPGFLASADPLVLAGVGGLATFGAIGAVALLLFGFGRKRPDADGAVLGGAPRESAMAGASGGSAASSDFGTRSRFGGSEVDGGAQRRAEPIGAGSGTPFEEPEFDEWGRPKDWVDAPSQGMPQGCIWAIGIGLFFVILIGPLPIAFFLGFLVDG